MNTQTPAEAFPLYWPMGWPRAKHREKNWLYKVTFEKAQRDLVKSLRIMGASNVVISTNVELRNDGLPRAGAADRRYDDPGVAVYFQRRGKPYVLACDKWEDVRGNLRAIGLTVDGMRAIERAGASDMLERAFQGFAQLPAAREAPASWWDVLGVDPNAGAAEIEAAYKEKIRKAHPDAGGSHEETVRLNKAREDGLAATRAA